MNNDLIYSDLSNLYAELQGIREELGDVRLRTIAVEYPNPTQPTFLVPKLIVTSPPNRLIGLSVGSSQIPILVTAEDLYVQSVNRNYPSELFTKPIWVDAVLNNNGALTGIRCTCKYLENKKGLYYNLVLRKDIEQRRTYA